MRIMVELANGLESAGGGKGHLFKDRTDEPMPTIQADRPVRYFVERGSGPVRSSTPSKPPYRVPSMTEIATVPHNGFDAVSTFSGCGGSCLGYRMAGFRVLWASEFVPAAQACYKANHPGSILDTRDIRQVKPEEILAVIGKAPGELDLLDGSPPCASFSTAGKREAGWGKVKAYSDTRQRTDDLFFEYVRILKGLRPKVFVAENVSGLVKGTAKGYFIEILRELKACGYKVEAKVLDAQWLGVPQARQRLIFVGVRDDLGLRPAFPKPLAYRYSVRDAMPWLGGSSVPLPSREDPVCGWKATSKFDRVVRPDDVAPTVMVHGRSQSAIVVETKSTEKRKFSIAELRRICGFPDDFILTGTYAQQWERLGRAVPPVMMSRIAATIRDEILCKISP